ncbi:MAG: carbon-nitrogen hydrolase [Planctomycetota bacterium]
MAEALKIGLTQMACGDDIGANVDAQIKLIHDAADAGAKVVCTQELFASKYFCQGEDHRFFDLAEPIPGPTTERLQAVAKEREIVVVGSLFEKRTAGLYHNTAVVIDADGSLLGSYRKMHIPDDPHYYEKFYFTTGDLGFRSFKTRYATIGVLICWDQWFPEAARLTAMSGAEILFYPTAIGWHPAEKAEFGQAQHEAWLTMMRSHAIANGCFVAAPNRIGHEHVLDPDGRPYSEAGIEFWGQSFLCRPDGQVAAEASVNEPGALVVDCDLSRVAFSRTHWPFLRDRRIDAYSEITRRLID